MLQRLDVNALVAPSGGQAARQRIPAQIQVPQLCELAQCGGQGRQLVVGQINTSSPSRRFLRAHGLRCAAIVWLQTGMGQLRAVQRCHGQRPSLSPSELGNPEDWIRHGTEDWLQPLVADAPHLGDGFAVWCAIGMQDRVDSVPGGTDLLATISALTFADRGGFMVTLQDLVLEAKQEARQETTLELLTEYVEVHWGSEDAADFRAQMTGEGAVFPTLRELAARHRKNEPPLPEASATNDAPPTDTKPRGGGTG